MSEGAGVVELGEESLRTLWDIVERVGASLGLIEPALWLLAVSLAAGVALLWLR